ncbi:pilus assembly protein [Paenibacillus glycanilyticus]|uniref:TadE/TadG family type IV pilus assembly protein n=1 Tax=Paenibacillus glycanilyticus TaxID=126569 RepID=UPI00203E5512|nr:TadE/TadG family type IV pilus assembly protein [Paenibacillus glycanilyticus]MCM3628820.1 pilus assembly protein [Paenibacillus glycanilyticus]
MMKPIKSSPTNGRKCAWLQWLRHSEGSFTLESTLVFPIIFLLILMFLLLSMYIYQKVVLYYSATETAERASFSWDNSHRNARNGMLTTGQYDGLYWRVSGDYMLGSLFGMTSDQTDVTLELPGPLSEEEKLELAGTKLRRASNWLTGDAGLPFQGNIAYANSLMKREVAVKLKQPVSLAPLELTLGLSEPKTAASASIVDPVQFIRDVDMLRYYTAKFNNGTSKQQAAKALTAYSGGGKAGKP